MRGFVLPIFLIQPLIWLGVIAFGLLILLAMKHSYEEKLKEKGREEVRVEAARRTFRQQEAWSRTRDNVEASATKVEVKHRERFAPIYKEANRIDPQPEPYRGVSPAAASEYERLFNDARNSADSARSTPVPAEAAPAPARSTPELVIQLYDWAGRAIERDEQWRNYYEALKKDQQAQKEQRDGKAAGIFSVAP